MSDKMLNHDLDEARALHRIVRAMHDGECPKCHKVHPSDRMRFHDFVADQHFPGEPMSVITGWRCPSCRFTIYESEAEAVFQIFAPFMERNLAIFEQWRESRTTR